MKSLTYKLAMILVIMAIPPVIIGVNAAWSMSTAFSSLAANDRALSNLTGLLQSAGRMLRENTELQNNANHAAGQMAEAHDATSDTLRNMAEDIIPKADAIARIRIALLEVSAAERALLLALNMRHLEMDELDDTRENQLRTFDDSLAAIDGPRTVYQARIADADERRAWEDFVKALDAWWQNHLDFMNDIDALDVLVVDLVRAGPLFSAASRKAYDTVFVTGRTARENCESRLQVLVRSLDSITRANVESALRSQSASAHLLADVGSEAEAAAQRSTATAAQFDRALAAADEATAIAAKALNDTVGRSQFLTILSVLGGLVAFGIGIFLALRISRPIRSIALHMAKLSQGNVADDVPEAYRSRNDEVGQLARAMQELVYSNRTEIAMANAMANGDYTKSIALRSDGDQLGIALRTMLSTSNSTLRHVGTAVERMSDGAQSVSDASRCRRARRPRRRRWRRSTSPSATSTRRRRRTPPAPPRRTSSRPTAATPPAAATTP